MRKAQTANNAVALLEPPSVDVKGLGLIKTDSTMSQYEVLRGITSVRAKMEKGARSYNLSMSISPTTISNPQCRYSNGVRILLLEFVCTMHCCMYVENIETSP